MRSGTELRQSLRIFLPTLSFIWCVCCVKGSTLPVVCGIKYDYTSAECSEVFRYIKIIKVTKMIFCFLNKTLRIVSRP